MPYELSRRRIAAAHQSDVHFYLPANSRTRFKRRLLFTYNPEQLLYEVFRRSPE